MQAVIINTVISHHAHKINQRVVLQLERLCIIRNIIVNNITSSRCYRSHNTAVSPSFSQGWAYAYGQPWAAILPVFSTGGQNTLEIKNETKGTTLIHRPMRLRIDNHWT